MASAAYDQYIAAHGAYVTAITAAMMAFIPYGKRHGKPEDWVPAWERLTAIATIKQLAAYAAWQAWRDIAEREGCDAQPTRREGLR